MAIAVSAIAGIALPAGAQAQPSTQPVAATPDSAAYQQFVFAYRLLQRNEDKLAIDAFDEFLRKYPQDERRGDATYYRALLAHRAGDNQTATKLLSNCPPPKLLPPNDVPLLHAQVYCDLGRFDPALAVLEHVNLATADSSSKATVLYLTAVAYRGSGNLPGAVQSFDAAGAIDSPWRARSLLEEARLDVQLDKHADAVAVLQRCLALKDAQVQPAAALLGGDEAYRLGNYAQAVEFYQAVITGHQSSPQFGPAVIGTMWAQLAAKQYDAALKTCQSVRPALSPADGYVADFLAGTALEDMGKYDEAIKRFDALLAAAPSPEQPRDKVAYNLAFSQYQLARFDDMSRTLGNFTTTYPQSQLIPDADYLQAMADVKRGDAAAGAARLTAIIAQGYKSPYQTRALLDRAKLYESTNQPGPAVDDYKRFLALAAHAQPPTELALIAEGSLRLTDLQMRLNQYADAEKTATTLLAHPGLDPLTEQDALYRQGLALVKQQKLEPALASFQALMTRHPENKYLAECHYYRGLLLAGLGRLDDSTADLLAAAQSLPTALKAQSLRIASIHLRDKNDPRAKDVLIQLATLIGIPNLKPDEAIWLARHLEQDHKPTDALTYLAPLLDVKSVSPGTPEAPTGPAQAEAAYVAGICLRDNKDFKGALDAFRRVVALNHGFELEARLEVARTLVASGQSDAALDAYAPLISAQPSGIASAAIYESAQVHRQRAQQMQQATETDAAHRELTEAQRLLKRLVLLYPFPQLSPLPELSYLELSEIETDLGQGDNATADLRELGDRFPDGPYASYARAVLLQQQNKKGEAVFLLKKLHEQTLDPRLASRVDHRLQSLETTP